MVFYGDKSNWWACYAFWTFKLFGHENCLIMNGGRQKWNEEDKPLTKEVPQFPQTTYTVKESLEDKIRAFRDDIVAHTGMNLPLIDVRSPDNLNSLANEIILEVIHRRYQTNATIIVTNRPIEDWGKIFGDNAMASAILDCFLENVHLIKITGKSYRLKNMKSKDEKMIDSKT